MGLVNAVVPHDKLDAEVRMFGAPRSWARVPTALALAKRSFNMDSEGIRAIGAFGFEALGLYYKTDEAKEGVNAFKEKRQPDFRKHAK